MIVLILRLPFLLFLFHICGGAEIRTVLSKIMVVWDAVVALLELNHVLGQAISRCLWAQRSNWGSIGQGMGLSHESMLVNIEEPVGVVHFSFWGVSALREFVYVVH